MSWGGGAGQGLASFSLLAAGFSVCGFMEGCIHLHQGPETYPPPSLEGVCMNCFGHHTLNLKFNTALPATRWLSGTILHMRNGWQIMRSTNQERSAVFTPSMIALRMLSELGGGVV